MRAPCFAIPASGGLCVLLLLACSGGGKGPMATPPAVALDGDAAGAPDSGGPGKDGADAARDARAASGPETDPGTAAPGHTDWGSATATDAASPGAPPDAAAASADAGDADPDAGPGPSGPCPAGMTYPSSPLPPVAQRRATPVVDGFSFLEGPVWHAQLGVLFFSDMNMAAVGPDGIAARILRLTPPATVEELVAASGSNGLGLSLDGRLLAATHDAQTLSLFDPRTAARETLALRYMGKRFNSPNDLAIRRDGVIFFTDPDWQLPPRTSETGFTGVYRVGSDGAVTLVDDTLDKPNGIALSPAEDVLYVGSRGREVYAYSLDASGVPGQRSIFAAPGSSDGMTVDCAGNLYVTSADVVVYDPAGTELGRVTVSQSPTNVAFGGPERRTLYITAGPGLYQIPLRVPGHPF